MMTNIMVPCFDTAIPSCTSTTPQNDVSNCFFSHVFDVLQFAAFVSSSEVKFEGYDAFADHLRAVLGSGVSLRCVLKPARVERPCGASSKWGGSI